MQTGNNARKPGLRVGGLVPLSTTDYPDHLSAVVFCQGCPWRCAYCHNPHLLPRRSDSEIAWPDVLAFLDRRRGLLDAVVFSGGEPTLQRALPDAMREVRALGYKIALHTAGMHPRRLAETLPLLDWVGMDIKTEFHRYSDITRLPGSGERARQSMAILLASGVAHEFRTPVDGSLIAGDRLRRLAHSLAADGVRHYVLQQCRAVGSQNSRPPRDVASRRLDAALEASLAPQFDTFTIRRA